MGAESEPDLHEAEQILLDGHERLLEVHLSPADDNGQLTERNLSLAEVPRLQSPQPRQHVLVLVDGFFIPGTVEEYCQDSKHGTISRADSVEYEFSSPDSNLIFLRGEYGMICKTCGEEYRRCKNGQNMKADLICTCCKHAFHMDCFSPLRNDNANYKTPCNWMCPGCARKNGAHTGAVTGHSDFRNREWPLREGSESGIRINDDDDDGNIFCLLCGHAPIEVHTYARSEDVEISMDQCVSCRSLVCWNCSSRFLGMSKTSQFKCWDCSEDGEHDRSFAVEFTKLAKSVALELKKKIPHNQALLDRFAGVMMSLLHNFHANLFQEHLHLLVQVVQHQLRNGCIPSLVPFDLLELMGMHVNLNLDFFIQVSKAVAQVHEKSAQSSGGPYPHRPELNDVENMKVAFFYSDAGNHPTQCLIR